tara:strand:+ start:278 stop:499 length:222 start_codon:yes stop_codon:yes gene_type:complete
MTYQLIKRKECHQFHPIRRVNLIDGSVVYIDLVTGITCSLDEQLGKVEELEEKYKLRCLAVQSIIDAFRDEDK